VFFGPRTVGTTYKMGYVLLNWLGALYIRERDSRFLIFVVSFLG
jgi:hypothetical protein